MTECTLGIDIGTFESKGVLVDGEGQMIASAARPHRMLVPQPGWAEHVPDEDWWGDFVFITKKLIADSGVAPGDIRVYDNFSVGQISDLEQVTGDVGLSSEWGGNQISVVEGDIRDREQTAAGLKGANHIIHLAACTGVVPSVKDPLFDCEQNVMGTLNVLEAARHDGASSFIFASSSAPVGMCEPPVHEELAPNPASPYGASKLAGEGYCKAYANCFDVKTVALRFGNLYGFYSSHKESVVANFIGRAMRGENLEIYGDGTATRDYIFADDLSEAIYMAATKDVPKGSLYQIATHSETTVTELAEALTAVLKRHGVTGFDLVHTAPRKGDVARNFADISKARNELGWTPTTSLEDGLERTVAWFMAKRQSA